MGVDIQVQKDKFAADAGVARIMAACTLAATMAFAQNAWAQDQLTGVSHPPDPSTIVADPADTPNAPAKPSAAVPADQPASTPSTTVYKPYVPYKPSAADAATAAKPFDPDANIVTEATAGRADHRVLSEAATGPSTNPADAGLVTYVPSRPGEIPDGTLVKVKLRESLSTLTTKPGTRFTAEVSEPVVRDGRVIVPVGAVLEGRVTWLRGGKRIGGPAAIHLEPRTVTLPDGAEYILRARVIDTDRWNTTKVDREGTILRSEHGKGTAAAMSLATGGGMAAGAIMGGVPGALIGAGVGAGVGTVVWLKQDRQAILPRDFGLVFSLTEPMSVTPASAHLAQPEPSTPGGE